MFVCVWMFVCGCLYGDVCDCEFVLVAYFVNIGVCEHLFSLHMWCPQSHIVLLFSGLFRITHENPVFIEPFQQWQGVDGSRLACSLQTQ